MAIDSGTGGSGITVRSFGWQWRTHADAFVGEVRANGTLAMKGGYLVDDKQVIGGREPAIADNKTDSEKLALVLATLRNHGLIER